MTVAQNAPPPSRAAFQTVIERREACSLLDRGALVTIRRAPFDAAQLRELGNAMTMLARSHPRGVVSLMTYRLSPEFPVSHEHLSAFEELANAARSSDRVIVAHAVVLEFGGVRAAAMRVLAKTVWQLARPRGALAHFDRITEAAAWLAPYARAIGATDDPADYVRGYREADRVLASFRANRTSDRW